MLIKTVPTVKTVVKYNQRNTVTSKPITVNDGKMKQSRGTQHYTC